MPTDQPTEPTCPWVYFLRAATGGPIAIVNREPPEEYELLLVIEGHLAEVRKRFDHIRAKGAWFAADPSLLAFIAERATDPVSVEVLARRIRESRSRFGEDIAVDRKSKFQVLCRPAYRKWLDRFAEREGCAFSKLIDRALAEYARTRGYAEPPRR